MSVAESRTVLAWYFEAGKPHYKRIQLNASDDVSARVDDITRLLGCKTFDAKYFNTPLGRFGIYFNDNGIYEDTVPNPIAEKVIGKIPLLWGTFNGNYLVLCDTKEEVLQDMPSITCAEFITQCWTAICGHRKGWPCESCLRKVINFVLDNDKPYSWRGILEATKSCSHKTD